MCVASDEACSAEGPPEQGHPQVCSECSCLVESSSKPYLGGYRNIKNGSLYHHACSQTPWNEIQHSTTACSATQTVSELNRSVQTLVDAATQCPRPGWYEDRSGLRTVLPSEHHETAAQLLARKSKAAVVLQRYLRGWLARRRCTEIRNASYALDEFIAAQRAKQQQHQDEYRQAEIRRRMQPRTAADFAILRDEVSIWWKQERDKIKGAEADDKTKQEAMRNLLAKETKLLQTIDRLRLVAAAPNRGKKAELLLHRLAAPKVWPLQNGQLVEVHTPDTLRAAELAELYRSLISADGHDLDQRLAVLTRVRHVAAESNSKGAWELLHTTDREVDLLSRGRSPVAMEGLRQRIANDFLELIQLMQSSSSCSTQPAARVPGFNFTKRNADYPATQPIGI